MNYRITVWEQTLGRPRKVGEVACEIAGDGMLRSAFRYSTVRERARKEDFTTDLGNEGNPEGIGECFAIFAPGEYTRRKNRETPSRGIRKRL